MFFFFDFFSVFFFFRFCFFSKACVVNKKGRKRPFVAPGSRFLEAKRSIWKSWNLEPLQRNPKRQGK